MSQCFFEDFRCYYSFILKWKENKEIQIFLIAFNEELFDKFIF